MPRVELDTFAESFLFLQRLVPHFLEGTVAKPRAGCFLGTK